MESTVNNIIFISDLHFGFTKGNIKNIFSTEAALQMKDDFIAFVKENYADNILCLAGDFFNSDEETLCFINELEENHIKGFFVLGNHDYWNNGTKSHEEIIELFSNETKANKYFKFLVTGRKYYFNDICVIGDTGWTSFRRGKRKVNLKQFMCLPDARFVKDFDPEKIIALHDEWISFANNILNIEKKVLIVTHFPMTDFTREDRDCWWTSTTALKGENSWRIFGHNHFGPNPKDNRRFNNVSIQRGNYNKNIESLKREACEKSFESQNPIDWNISNKAYKSYLNKKEKYIKKNWVNFKPENQYSYCDFGRLEKVFEISDMTVTNGIESISAFFSPVVVSDIESDLELISDIQSYGYKRCAWNKNNLAALANDPEGYIQEVKEKIAGYLTDTYIGYSLSRRLHNSTVEAVYNSIAILEKGDFSDVRAFMTAAVITGYVYNCRSFDLAIMRPLNDYDIIRFWMMFLTIKKYNIDMKSIDNIHRDKKKSIIFANVEIYLPIINGFSLDIDEVQMHMQKTPLLPLPNTFLKNNQ